MVPPIRVGHNKVGDLISPRKRLLGVPDALRNRVTLLPTEGEVSNGLEPQHLERGKREEVGHQTQSCLTLMRGTGNTAGSRLGMNSWVLLPTTVRYTHTRTGIRKNVFTAATLRTGGNSGTSGSRRSHVSPNGDRSTPQNGGFYLTRGAPSVLGALLPHTRLKEGAER